MTPPEKSDGHRALATRAVADIMNLDLLGRWPASDRAHWVIWSLDAHASPGAVARVLGVTNERVRQIYQRELRLRAEREAER